MENENILQALKVFIEVWEDTYAMENESHPFEEDEDENEKALKELNEELRELMELQGFEHWQTGGGCTAWGKHLLGGLSDKSPYMMITVSDDATAYFYDLADAHQENAITIYFYSPDGSNFSGGVYYSWDDFKEYFKGGF
jgi:hypothetical protein